MLTVICSVKWKRRKTVTLLLKTLIEMVCQIAKFPTTLTDLQDHLATFFTSNFGKDVKQLEHCIAANAQSVCDSRVSCYQLFCCYKIAYW